MENINFLKQKSAWLRKQIFEMCNNVQQGHPGSVLSEIDILISLFYGGIINFEKGNPESKKRDRIIVSKGHATMGLYPIFSDIGYFENSELTNYGKSHGILRIFGNIDIPGIDATTGSLGHGLGIGSGFALADKLDNLDRKTFVILSEGEMYEGSVWESALFTSHFNLDNLILIIDRNRKIILGDTEDLIKLESIEDKWESFGFNTARIDGHSHKDLIDTFNEHIGNNKPTVIIADTIKGKGISFMENNPSWHYWQKLDESQLKKARIELNEEISKYE
jgi:transketolase